MAITKFAKEYHDKMFPGYVSSFLETDPEFIERFDNFQWICCRPVLRTVVRKVRHTSRVPP